MEYAVRLNQLIKLDFGDQVWIKSITETIDLQARLDLDRNYASKSNFIVSKFKTATWNLLRQEQIKSMFLLDMK